MVTELGSEGKGGREWGGRGGAGGGGRSRSGGGTSGFVWIGFWGLVGKFFFSEGGRLCEMVSSFRSYLFASVMLATGVVAHAAHVKHYFYPSVVYLCKSKFAMMVRFYGFLELGRSRVVKEIACAWIARREEVEQL